MTRGKVEVEYLHTHSLGVNIATFLNDSRRKRMEHLEKPATPCVFNIRKLSDGDLNTEGHHTGLKIVLLSSVYVYLSSSPCARELQTDAFGLRKPDTIWDAPLGCYFR